MKIRYVVALAVIFVAAIIVLGNVNYNGNSTKSTSTTIVINGQINNQTGSNDPEFDQYLEKYKQKRIFSDNSSIPDRASYGISQEVFKNLPPVPNDFLYRVYLIKYGRFVNIADLGPEYYKQPEFDPEFTRYGLRYWLQWKESNYSKKHWGTVGFRSYPYSQHLVTKPGYSFNVTLYLSSDWNVETYQGVRLTTIFLSRAISEDGKFYNASMDGEKYINVNVTPSEFLITPAFPQFTDDWVKKLTFTGKISNNTPEGVYVLSVKIDKPGQENSDKWLLQYLNLYSEGAGMVTADKPYLQAFINVEK